MSSPVLIFYSVQDHYYNGTNGSEGTYMGECSIQIETEIGLFYKNISHYINIVTSYLIPLVVICISYTRLLSFMKQSQKSLKVYYLFKIFKIIFLYLFI